MGIYTVVNANADVDGIDQAFEASENIPLVLNTPHPTRVVGQPFVGHLGALYVDVTIASGSPTKLTMRICAVNDADQPIIIPDTEATLAIGLTSSEASATYDIDIPYSDLSRTDTVYAFFKVDAGSVNIDTGFVRLTWTD